MKHKVIEEADRAVARKAEQACVSSFSAASSWSERPGAGLCPAERLGAGLCPAYCVDSRVLGVGDIFCAIVGSRVDGHDFVEDALRAGAGGVMVERAEVLDRIPESLLSGRRVIVVENTVAALVKMAGERRAMLSCPVLGITGSVGKTTTKEMLRSIFWCSGKKVFVSPGNLNSLLGVALSILRVELGVEVAVFEVGINDVGEMDEIVGLLRPTHGLITRIANSHTKGLGSKDGVAQEKLKLVSDVELAILHGGSPELGGMKGVYFGEGEDNDVRVVGVEKGYGLLDMSVMGRDLRVELNSCHQPFVTNALGAAAAAAVLGYDDDAIVRGLSEFKPVDGRFSWHACDGFVVIDDSYNANPESMVAAIRSFVNVEATNRIAVLGDMLELGEKSREWHKYVGEMLNCVEGIDYLVLVGENVVDVESALNRPCMVVKDWKSASSVVKQIIAPGTAVLLKASHGIGLSNLVQELQSR